MILRHDGQNSLQVLLNITKSLCYSGDEKEMDLACPKHFMQLLKPLPYS